MNNQDGLITCPFCSGKGFTRALVRMVQKNALPSGEYDLKCHVCDGLKSITPEHQAAIIEGERRREDRKARLISLRDEAKRLGISPCELSDIEWGRIPRLKLQD